MRAPRRSVARALTAMAVALACGGEPTSEPSDTPSAPQAESLSPTAQIDTYEAMRLDLEAPRHQSDGGGHATLVRAAVFDGPAGEPAREVELPAAVPAGGQVQLDLVYEAGPEGVATGGMVMLQVSPFWDWDTPQTQFAEAPGYTEIATDAAIEFHAATLAEGLLGIEITSGELAPGDRIELRYGAGPAGARVDRYAEHEARIWFAVDGDGDGIRALVPDPPSITTVAGEAARIVAFLPATAKVGDVVALRVALLDRIGNAGVAFEGAFELEATPGLELDTTLRFEAGDGGTKSMPVRVTQPGVQRVRIAGQAADAPPISSNPLVVRDDVPRILFGDLHGHSNLSDGTGTPEDYLHYARNVAALDVIALTDHDHWGMQFLDTSPALWERIRRATREANAPGEFVALLGFEWTSWLQGHRHVLYFADDGPVISSLDDATSTPTGLWSALEGQPALTFAHHSAGGPVATNWSFAPDPRFEPVTEIVSVHGSSEAPDSPSPIYSPVPGNSVRDVLLRGYRLGFIGSGDSHDGHPGLPHLASGSGLGGLAAFFSEDLSRAGVLAALRARRVYATNGERIFLRVLLGGVEMGGSVEASTGGDPVALEIEVAASAPLVAIELIRGGVDTAPTIEAIPVDGELDWHRVGEVAPLAAGEFLYVRVLQHGGGAAWSSPFFADAANE